MPEEKATSPAMDEEKKALLAKEQEEGLILPEGVETEQPAAPAPPRFGRGRVVWLTLAITLACFHLIPTSSPPMGHRMGGAGLAPSFGAIGIAPTGPPCHHPKPNVTAECSAALHNSTFLSAIRTACTPKPPPDAPAPPPPPGDGEEAFVVLDAILGGPETMSFPPPRGGAHPPGGPGGPGGPHKGCPFKRAKERLDAFCADTCEDAIDAYFDAAEAACGSQVIIPPRPSFHHGPPHGPGPHPGPPGGPDQPPPEPPADGPAPPPEEPPSDGPAPPDAQPEVPTLAPVQRRPQAVPGFATIDVDAEGALDKDDDDDEDDMEDDDDDDDDMPRRPRGGFWQKLMGAIGRFFGHGQAQPGDENRSRPHKGPAGGRWGMGPGPAMVPGFMPAPRDAPDAPVLSKRQFPGHGRGGPHRGPGGPHPGPGGPPPHHGGPHGALFRLISLAQRNASLTVSDLRGLFDLVRDVKCAKAGEPEHYCPISAHIVLETRPHGARGPHGPPHRGPGGPPHGPPHRGPGGPPHHGPGGEKEGMGGGWFGWFGKGQDQPEGRPEGHPPAGPGPEGPPFLKDACACITAETDALEEGAEGLRAGVLKPWLVPRAEYIKARVCSWGGAMGEAAAEAEAMAEE